MQIMAYGDRLPTACTVHNDHIAATHTLCRHILQHIAQHTGTRDQHECTIEPELQENTLWYPVLNFPA